MSSAIAPSTATWPGTYGTGGCACPTGGTSSTAQLTQAEQQLFAAIDTNGNGSISPGELTNFIRSMGGSSATTGSSLNTLGSSGAGGMSLQDVQNNSDAFITALRTQLAGSAVASGSTSAAGQSPASATSSAANGTQGVHHPHHGHGGGTQLAALLQMLASAASNPSASSSGTSSTGTSGTASTVLAVAAS